MNKKTRNFQNHTPEQIEQKKRLSEKIRRIKNVSFHLNTWHDRIDEYKNLYYDGIAEKSAFWEDLVELLNGLDEQRRELKNMKHVLMKEIDNLK